MNDRAEPTPAALYVRVSSDRQDVDLSVAAQLRALREHADKNGYVVVREYVDEAESGRVDDRPEFNRMIGEAKSPQAAFREILVWKFSRFTRKREHAVIHKSMLRRRGVRVVSITEQADDTPTGKLVEGIIESVDEFYSENLAQEVRRGMREAASRGFWMGSRAPYGYNRVMAQDGARKRPKLELDEVTARVVQRIFELAETGRGTLDIARALNEEGIASATGRLWAKTSISSILRNEVYTGTLVWGTAAGDQADPVRVERAFPAIISRAQFRRVGDMMRSRAPTVTHPRRVASPYVLSGLVRCNRCKTAFSSQESKGGRFQYYVCQSLVRRGSGSCDTPRLNARRFEGLIVERIRSSILTEGNMADLTKVVRQELSGLAREERKRLETIESELKDVGRSLDRLWRIVETTDEVPPGTNRRIKDNNDRKLRLEAAAAAARVVLSQRSAAREEVEAIMARVQDIGGLLRESELPDRRSFIATFVKEIVVMPGRAVVHYTVPMPSDSHSPGADSEEVLL